MRTGTLRKRIAQTSRHQWQTFVTGVNTPTVFTNGCLSAYARQALRQLRMVSRRLCPAAAAPASGGSMCKAFTSLLPPA